jgi:hypothetical protein
MGGKAIARKRKFDRYYISYVISYILSVRLVASHSRAS